MHVMARSNHSAACPQDGLEKGTLTKFIVVMLDQSAHAVEKHVLDIKVPDFRARFRTMPASKYINEKYSSPVSRALISC